MPTTPIKPLKPRRLIPSLLLVSLALAASAPAQQDAAPRPAEQVLADIAALNEPTFTQTRAQDNEYVTSYINERDEFFRRRAELAHELYTADPEHPELDKLLGWRWSFLGGADQPGSRDAALAEAERVMAERKGTPLASTAAYHRAAILGSIHGYDAAHYLPAVEEYLALDPGNERGAGLLMRAAQYGQYDKDQRLALYRRVTETYPESRAAGQAKGKIRQVQALGEPFELTFADAVSGRTIDMNDLKGKVVVVDFWATWCGPCVGEMPHMKELYAAHHPQGVEFIGVSLDAPPDKGGLDKLKEFVEKNDIPWPQYYQGDGWKSEFSASWGINSIPALFVVDQRGRLHSVDARGKLDTMIPELLAAGAPK